MNPEHPADHQAPAPAPEADEADWQRLDAKMLLLGPFAAVRQIAVPALIALIASGSQNIVYSLFALPVIVLGILLLGFLPWFTTRYRITETQLQRRSGLFSRKVVTAPLDRVRSVDLESPLLHRALSLAKVEVGTGVDDTRIELDSLSRLDADRLRHFLLERSRMTGPGPAPEPGPESPTETAAPTHTPAAPGATLAEIDWSWLRFAPFSLSKLVIVAGALGVASQFIDDLPFFDWEHIQTGWQWILDQALPWVIGVAAVLCLVGWLIISVGGYVIQWWDLRLFREHGNLRLVAGLFTTRSTTLEEARIRGVELTEPVLLRLVGGAELSTLSTGVEDGVTAVLPPAPETVAQRVGRDLLGTGAPLEVVPVAHGRRARRRCHVRQQWTSVVIALAGAGVVVLWDWPWQLPVLLTLAAVALGVLLGEQQYRHLGHALTEEHLVAGSGTTSRIRTVLERDGIIGWVIEQTYFQRRLGLATLIATTAAGSESVRIRDLDHARAVALADATTPGMLAEFLDQAAG